MSFAAPGHPVRNSAPMATSDRPRIDVTPTPGGSVLTQSAHAGCASDTSDPHAAAERSQRSEDRTQLHIPRRSTAFGPMLAGFGPPGAMERE